MSDDSTRIKTHEKVVGLHYSEVSTPTHCIDSAFTAKKPENRNFPGPVGKVGLGSHRNPMKMRPLQPRRRRKQLTLSLDETCKTQNPAGEQYPERIEPRRGGR